MLSNDTLLFLLIAHFLRAHDPGDPPHDRKLKQVLIASVIRVLATGVQDAGLRQQFHATADEVIVKNSRGGEESSERETMTAASA